MILRSAYRIAGDMSHFALRMCTDLAPVVISSAIEIGLKDSRVGRVVGSVPLLISGIHVSIQAAIRWKERDRTLADRITTLGIGAIGVAASVTALFLGAQGIFELFQSERASEPDCESWVSWGKKKYLMCPDAKELSRKVERDGPVSIQCTEEISKREGAIWDVHNRKIYVSNDLTEEMPLKIAQGMTSLANRDEHLKLTLTACEKPAEVFANEMELLIYRDTKNAYELAQRCAQKGVDWAEKIGYSSEEDGQTKWYSFKDLFEQSSYTNYIDPETNELKQDSWKTESDYLKMQMETGHTDLLVDMWKQNCRKND